MSITFIKDQAVMAGQVTVEEAETVLEWLIQHPAGRIDMQAVDHLHAATLQVLMAASPLIDSWPQNTSARLWLQGALTVGALQ